jgi:hypothetical protein
VDWDDDDEATEPADPWGSGSGGGGTPEGDAGDGGNDDGDDDDLDTGEGSGTVVDGADFANFINVTDAPVGDLSCFTGSLATELPADNCVAQRSMAGQVLDFQEDGPVDEATVEFFFADAIFGAPDETITTDANGVFNVEMNTCEPFTSRITTDPLLDATKVTIESHDVLPNMGAINPVSHELNSVSSSTYALIPTLLGVSPDVEKGIVAGRTYDCGGNNIEGLQVVIDDGSGNIPEDVIGKYFIDDFPSRSQPYTSADGLWVLIDVPVGNWTVRGYVADGSGGHLLVAQTELEVIADSINISSIYTGIEDGVKMPADCLTDCN